MAAALLLSLHTGPSCDDGGGGGDSDGEEQQPVYAKRQHLLLQQQQNTMHPQQGMNGKAPHGVDGGIRGRDQHQQLGLVGVQEVRLNNNNNNKGGSCMVGVDHWQPGDWFPRTKVCM